jgi:nicotinate-nucleotide pyrophosphorylase (carboxylating)
MRRGSRTKLEPADFLPLVRQALAEDIGAGDFTTQAIVPTDRLATAVMVAREPLVAAGLDLAVAAFAEVCTQIRCERCTRDGEQVNAAAILLRLDGPVWGILSGERVALNFVQRLSGVATLTAQFVALVRGTATRILDTRKTTPGWRLLEKYAVCCGGGQNHRLGLFDMVLIKDNHLAALREETPEPVTESVRRARARFPALPVEVEADTLAQVEQAVGAGADYVLLDNMNLDQLRAAVALVGGRCQTEASGGITLATVRAVAETGVDFISVGALTHSARAVDIGLDIVQ